MRKIKSKNIINKKSPPALIVDSLEDNLENDINSFILELASKLNLNQASVMVGAGFSKNAENMEKNTELPAWVDLGEPFYKKLHGGKSPPYKITDITEVQKLAAKIELNYERRVLDKIIENEIPDKKFKPSSLHFKLLNFSWRDVFTTNYDTLLEKASSGKYEEITAQKKLRFSKQPRIIKLHGSFSSNTPYIITEKDYDDYPKKYRAFVNIVENALMETMFCLVGFSGNDPNFLSWIKWLKKAMGHENAPKIYFIGVQISEDEKKSLMTKNIRAIDISSLDKKIYKKIMPDPTGKIKCELAPDDYKAVYNKFFDKLLEYINNDIEEDDSFEINSSLLSWPVNKHVFLYTEKDIRPQYIEALNIWKEDRLKYPGWIILPEDKRKILRNSTETLFIHYLKKINNFLDIQFLYEFNWRIEKYLYPLYDDWAETYKVTLDKYNPFPMILKSKNKNVISTHINKVKWNEISVIWIDLHFALLRYYRQKGMDKEWKNISKIIEKIKHKLNYEQKTRYHYEKCLFQLFNYDIHMLRKELSDWKVNYKNPYWMVKRAGLIAELGNVCEALKIIKISINKIDIMIKSKKNYQLFSQKAYMLDLLNYVRRSACYFQNNLSWDDKEYEKINSKIQELKKYGCAPLDDLDYFDTGLEFNAPDYKNTVIDYGFELNTFFKSSIYGSDKYSLRACSFLIYIEEIGYPLTLPHVYLSNKAINQSINRLYKFYPSWSLTTLIRARDKKNVEKILSRKIISNIQNDYADSLFAHILNILKKLKNEINKGGKSLNNDNSLTSVLFEILGRLCIKANYTLRNELLLFIKNIYCSKNRQKYGEFTKLMEHLISSFSFIEQYKLINIFLDFPVLKDDLRYKYPDPFSFIDLIKIKKTKHIALSISKINETLNYLEGNDNKREKAIIRLLVLWKCDLLTKNQINKFASALWKFTNDDGFPTGAANQYYYSAFLWFPHPKYVNPGNILKNYFINIKLPVQSMEKEKSIMMTNGHFMLFGNIIGTFNSRFVYEWSRDELNILLEKIIEWWNADKIFLKKETKNERRDESIRNEFKARFNNMLSIFACVFQPNIEKIEKDYINKINPVLSELKEYHIPDIMAKASFVKVFPDTLQKIINDICIGLFSKDEEIISDAIAGIMVLLRQKCDGINKIISDISQNIKCRTETDLYRLISIMNTIVCDYPEYIDNVILENINIGLHELIKETVIDEESTEKDTHIRQICRKYSVELSSSLKKYYQKEKIEIPEFINEWEKISHDANEVVEIRNAWIS